MIGHDFSAIQKCFDLKGSLLGRKTEITKEDEETGETGFKVLKDINFIEFNEKLQLNNMEKELIL